jgi:DNA-binding XRE family transcriptional regulator
MGQKIRQHRLKLRKSRKQLALELSVSQKTPWGWETDRWQPSTLLKERIGVGLTL